jgi:hypothetical protein
MITPESMTQITLPTGDLLDYEIILPLGTYTSGTYSIPNGRTWDDFFLLVFLGGRDTLTMGCTFYPDEMFSSAGWDTTLAPDFDGSRQVAVSYVNATSMSVSNTGGGGAAHMMIGYLK